MEQALKCTYHGTLIIDDETWEKVKPYVEAAAQFSSGEFTAEDVRISVRRGEQEMWIVWRGDKVVWCWVTEIMTRNHRKICQVVAAGGTDHEAGWHYWLLMCRWLTGLGIDKAEVWCRPSMARLLKRKNPNFKTKYEVMEIQAEVL